MNRRIVCVWASLVGLWTGSGDAAELLLGVSPADGMSMFVKQFSLSAGATIEGIEFRNNDPQTVFPEVLLIRDVVDAVNEGTVVARAANVRETSPGQVRVLWSQPVRVSEPGTYWAAVRMPAGQRKDALGNGPALGATEVSSANGSFVAGGPDGGLTAIRADLTLSLVTAGAGKAGPEKTPQALRTFLSGTSPAHSVVTIQFGVEQRTHAVLAIYNVAGQRVRRLLAGPVDAGAHSQEWDGRDENGRDVATGIYIAKLQAGEKSVTQKLLLTR